MRTYTFFSYKKKEGIDFEEFTTSLGKPYNLFLHRSTWQKIVSEATFKILDLLRSMVYKNFYQKSRPSVLMTIGMEFYPYL